MPYLHRHLEQRVLSLSQSYPAILLTGPRQVGKTTMLQKLAAEERGGTLYGKCFGGV